LKEGALGEAGKKRSRPDAAKQPDAAKVDAEAGVVPGALEADEPGLTAKTTKRGRPKKVRKESAGGGAAGLAVGNSAGAKDGSGAGPGGVPVAKARRGRPKMKKGDVPVLVVHRKPRQARGHGRVGGEAAGAVPNTGGQRGAGERRWRGWCTRGRAPQARQASQGQRLSCTPPARKGSSGETGGWSRRQARGRKKLGRPPKLPLGEGQAGIVLEEGSKDTVGKGQESGARGREGGGQGAAASGGVATVKGRGRRGRPPKFPKAEGSVKAEPTSGGQGQEEGGRTHAAPGKPVGTRLMAQRRARLWSSRRGLSGSRKGAVQAPLAKPRAQEAGPAPENPPRLRCNGWRHWLHCLVAEEGGASQPSP